MIYLIPWTAQSCPAILHSPHSFYGYLLLKSQGSSGYVWEMVWNINNIANTECLKLQENLNCIKSTFLEDN
jgi:hypothetical protein